MNRRGWLERNQDTLRERRNSVYCVKLHDRLYSMIRYN